MKRRHKFCVSLSCSKKLICRKAKDKISEKRSLFTALWKKKSFSLWEIMISIGCGTRNILLVFWSQGKVNFRYHKLSLLSPTSATRQCTTHKKRHEKNFMTLQALCGVCSIIIEMHTLCDQEKAYNHPNKRIEKHSLCVYCRSQRSRRRTSIKFAKTVSHKAGFQNFGCHDFEFCNTKTQESCQKLQGVAEQETLLTEDYQTRATIGIVTTKTQNPTRGFRIVERWSWDSSEEDKPRLGLGCLWL